jgi:acyl-CoA thioesterase FadM
MQYRDLDAWRHVNHVVYAAYLEQARGRFFRDVFGVSLADAPTRRPSSGRWRWTTGRLSTPTGPLR